MALDITFNRNAALQAGIEIKVVRNGTDAEIYQQENRRDPDRGYISWLKQEHECILVPNTEYWLENIGSSGLMTVTCNSYTIMPMTRWLKANKIRYIQE